METPGAQELNKEYTFKYSIFVHHKKLPMNEIINQAEAFALEPKTYSFTNSKINDELLDPLFHLEEAMIKVSSVRVRKNKLLILLYNLSEIKLQTTVEIASLFNKCTNMLIDGSIKEELLIKDKKVELVFNPFELKLLQFEK
jgi:hypothetical protein